MLCGRTSGRGGPGTDRAAGKPNAEQPFNTGFLRTDACTKESDCCCAAAPFSNNDAKMVKNTRLIEQSCMGACKFTAINSV